jgi:tetratricopeptide (TPR) repeat protein
LLCLAHGIYRHRPYQTLIAGFCLVAWPLFVLWISLPGYYYSRLNQAKVWHRWDEVLGCVQAIRKIAKWSVVKFPEVELDKCTAQALASEGRLEEGLRIFEKHSATVPPFLYCSQVSTIYDAAKEQDKALEYAEKAVELAPENGTLLLDLAFRLSMHHNRPAESRALLARVDQSVLIPYARAYVPFVEGIILFRENRFDEARAELLKAVAGIGKFLHQDLTRGSWLLAKSYLCAAEQKLGNFSAVKKLWKETQQFLVAHREDELIALCEPVSAVPVR